MLPHSIDAHGVALADEAVIAALVNVEDVTVLEAANRLHVSGQLEEGLGEAGYFASSNYADLHVFGLLPLLRLGERLASSLDGLAVLQQQLHLV